MVLAIVSALFVDDVAATNIVKKLRRIQPGVTLIVRCRYQGSVEKLRTVGADAVISEETEAAFALLRTLAKLDTDDSSAS